MHTPTRWNALECAPTHFASEPLTEGSQSVLAYVRENML